MRRWNGWGDNNITFPLYASAAQFLKTHIGVGQPTMNVDLESILQSIPASRLPLDARLSTDPYERLIHARGQSLPDWVALRSGQISSFPDGILYPQNDEEIRQIYQFASKTGVSIIPYGGGTSVLGHINPKAVGKPVITVDLKNINQLIELNPENHLACFGCGANGPLIEKQLNRQGFTLGHFPQSFELSTLGGWIATRSCGQQSYYYGRIEDLFAGGHLESPAGPLDLPVFPASAAGPDLRNMVLGSEGQMGIITRATVRIRPLPQNEHFYGIFFPDWETGVSAVKEIAQATIPVSMMRLSNSLETETTLLLSGKDRLVGYAKRGLNFIGYGPERALLILGITGDDHSVNNIRRQAFRVLHAHRGLSTGTMIGKTWKRSRFLTPYLRNTLWDEGYAADTLETAITWTSVIPTTIKILETMRQTLEREDERILAFAHLSHIYTDGASIYITYIFRKSPDPDITLHRWRLLKSAASRVIQDQGGTISHQHGVGEDHAEYLPSEKGILGIKMIDEVRQLLDPERLMNPGKLIPAQKQEISEKKV